MSDNGAYRPMSWNYLYYRILEILPLRDHRIQLNYLGIFSPLRLHTQFSQLGGLEVARLSRPTFAQVM